MADCMIFRLRESWLTARAAVTRALDQHHLSVAQFTALLAIREAPGASVSDIARTVATTRQTAAQLVTGLVEAGLVQREDDAHDARAQCLFLSGAGRRQLALAEPSVKAAEAQIEAGLDDGVRQAARVWLSHLAERASEHES